MKRRTFFSVLAAPFIVQPTLEEIDRLTWRRRFFPGYTPPANTGGYMTFPINWGMGRIKNVSFVTTCNLQSAMLAAVAEAIERDLLAMRAFPLGDFLH